MAERTTGTEFPADAAARLTMLGIWLTVDSPDPDDTDDCDLDGFARWQAANGQHVTTFVDGFEVVS